VRAQRVFDHWIAAYTGGPVQRVGGSNLGALSCARPFAPYRSSGPCKPRAQGLPGRSPQSRQIPYWGCSRDPALRHSGAGFSLCERHAPSRA